MDSKIEKTNEVNKRQCKAWLRQYSYEIIGVFIIAIGLIFFMLHRRYDSSAPIDAGLWGQFGDYVGGIVGSLIAYVSIRLLSQNLQEQIRANNEIKKNNENSVKVFELQQFDSTFNTLLNLYKDAQAQVQLINIDSILNHSCAQPEYPNRVNEVLRTFTELYSQHLNVLSSYFRLIYRIMQIIDEAPVGGKIQTRYAKIFRCQLSEKELLLIRYNAMTHYGSKMRHYIIRYNLLKHLPLLMLSEFRLNQSSILGAESKDLLNSIFSDLRKFLVCHLCEKGQNNIVDKVANNKFKFGHYNCSVSFGNDKQIIITILFEYVKGKNTSFPLTDPQFKQIIEFFMYETFVVSSFGLYQTLEKVNIMADMSQEHKSQKHTIWASISHKDGYNLVLSQGQLSNPQKK